MAWSTDASSAMSNRLRISDGNGRGWSETVEFNVRAPWVDTRRHFATKKIGCGCGGGDDDDEEAEE